MARAAVSENGWPTVWRAACETVHVPGTQHVDIELLAGDAATVLAGALAWIHRNVRNIEPIDGHRNWWGHDNSTGNAVADSNHYSGTAADFCADELPWQQRTMPQNQIDLMHRLLSLWEGLLFWGGDWNRVDQMHIQLNGGTFNNPRLAEFAQRLRNGYLGLFGPPDPDAFPLPGGYYYGPLEGPIESVSGEYASDSAVAKDGLGRWQQALGLPVTKKWNDGVTPRAATVLQKAKGWSPNPLFGYGGVYLGEWDAVIREGWRLPPGWDQTPTEPVSFVTKWGDYSQYQAARINDSYPYRVVCFRASIGNTVDTAFADNLARADAMVAAGRIDKVIAYHFWVPGVDNFGTFAAAIGPVTPQLAFMLDLEDGGAKWNIRGDQSTGVLDFLRRGQDLFVNDAASSLYVNFNANPDLMPVNRIPPGLKIIVPRYAGPDKPPVVPEGVRVFAHQYASDENTSPFGPTDINQALLPLDQFLAAWGTNGGAPPPADEPPPAEQPPVVVEPPVTVDTSDDALWRVVLAQFSQ